MLFAVWSLLRTMDSCVISHLAYLTFFIRTCAYTLIRLVHKPACLEDSPILSSVVMVYAWTWIQGILVHAPVTYIITLDSLGDLNVCRILLGNIFCSISGNLAGLCMMHVAIYCITLSSM